MSVQALGPIQGSDQPCKLGDLYNTRVPWFSVFNRGLAQSGGWEVSLAEVGFLLLAG